MVTATVFTRIHACSSLAPDTCSLLCDIKGVYRAAEGGALGDMCTHAMATLCLYRHSHILNSI